MEINLNAIDQTQLRGKRRVDGVRSLIHHTDFEYFATLDPAQQTRLLKCLKTGWENPDSGLGCYAMAPSDYDEFAPFFFFLLLSL